MNKVYVYICMELAKHNYFLLNLSIFEIISCQFYCLKVTTATAQSSIRGRCSSVGLTWIFDLGQLFFCYFFRLQCIDASLLLQMQVVCMCRCVCWSQPHGSCAETAEPIEMSFVVWTRVGPRNYVLRRETVLPRAVPIWRHLPAYCRV